MEFLGDIFLLYWKEVIVAVMLTATLPFIRKYVRRRRAMVINFFKEREHLKEALRKAEELAESERLAREEVERKLEAEAVSRQKAHDEAEGLRAELDQERTAREEAERKYQAEIDEKRKTQEKTKTKPEHHELEALSGAAAGNKWKTLLDDVKQQIDALHQSSTTITIYVVVEILLDTVESMMHSISGIVLPPQLSLITPRNWQHHNWQQLLINVIHETRAMLQAAQQIPLPHPIVTSKTFFQDNGWVGGKISLFSMLRCSLFKASREAHPSVELENVLKTVATDVFNMLESTTLPLPVSAVIATTLTSLITSIDAVYCLDSYDKVVDFGKRLAPCINTNPEMMDYLYRLKNIKAPILEYLMSKVTFDVTGYTAQ